MPFARSLPLYFGLLTAACSATFSHPVRPAGGTLSPELGESEPGGSDERDLDARAGARTLDLRSFEPLLARTLFREVRLLSEEGKPAEAALALEKVIDESDLANVDQLRAAYLLGSLHREAGESNEALSAFARASASDWPLRDNALIQVAELSLRREQASASLAALDKLNGLAESFNARAARARALAKLERFDEAAAMWRLILSERSTPEVRLALAGASLSAIGPNTPDAARVSLATEALREAQLAALGGESIEKGETESSTLAKKALLLGGIESSLSEETQMAHLRGLVGLRELDEAWKFSSTIVLSKKSQFSAQRCEFDHLVGKILAGRREWGAAADKIASSAEYCEKSPDIHAWLLFNAGKYSAADGRHTKAVAYYARLEQLYAKNSLADDARLRAARSYEKAGILAKFVELLSTMPEDYPDGDMTMEGVLVLALHQMERDDWSGAATVLSRAVEIVRGSDTARGLEHSGTERYFLARCQQELGQTEEALLEYESIVREVPLSYYMLHSYSRLLEVDPKRARAALEEGLSRARTSPFELPHQVEYESEEFVRGMELLLVGERTAAKGVFSKLGLGEGVDDSLLWGIALLYNRAGDAHSSFGLTQGRLSSWFAHYPEADWQAAWQLGFPRPYLSSVKKASETTGVPEWFIYGVMREESTFRPTVVSHANAYGLMQVIPGTARGIGKKYGLPYSSSALKRPATNIEIGSRVLQELSSRFKKNPWLAIPGYNAGPGRPIRWLHERPNVDFDVWVEMIPYRETRRYTKRVLASRAAYAFIYHREDAQTALVLPKRLTPR